MSMMVPAFPAHDRPTRLVLFHGLSSTPKEFGFIVHPLRRRGVTLQAPQVPGYSFEPGLAPTRWQAWVDAAARGLDELNAQAPGPFVLGGLCTGALLALAVAARRPWPGLRGLALLSPLFAYDGWSLPRWYRLRRIAYLGGIARFFAMAERPPYGLKNERMRQWVRQQMASGQATAVGPAQVDLRTVRESERLSAHVLRLMPDMTQPMLVQHARDDEICDLTSVQSALRTLRPGVARLRVLDNSYHMITADNDRHLVAEELADFVQALAVRTGPDFFQRDAHPLAADSLRLAIAP